MDDQLSTSDRKEDFELIWKKKPRTVNFCPYCRAVVAAAVTVPFVYLWRKYPHKPKPKKTREEITRGMERRSLIIRLIAGGINIALGLSKFITDPPGLWFVGVILIASGVILITAHRWGSKLVRWIIEHSPKVRWKRKAKPKKEKKPKTPSQLAKKIHEKHEIICPPIFFVDTPETESLR